MSESRASGRRVSEVGEGRIDPFLIRYVQANPVCGFGEIIEAARRSCRLSRATAARHLAKLVRFGDLAIGPDRKYVTGGGPTQSPPRASVEIRWVTAIVWIRPDGSARFYRN